MAHHNLTGQLGEKLAVDYFTKNNFEILHTNWRHSRWEVDIIASKANKLHFVEVKTRRTKNFGNPEEKVGKKKIQNLLNAAEEYLFLHPEWKMIQFDILAITITKTDPVEYFFIEDISL
ncbi:MAG: YraN family protein [Bacteroidota bacterium]